MDDRQAEKVSRELGLGALGTHTTGKLIPDDQGDLKAALTIKDGKLVLLFGKPVAWLAMTREEALALSALIRDRASSMA